MSHPPPPESSHPTDATEPETLDTAPGAPPVERADAQPPRTAEPRSEPADEPARAATPEEERAPDAQKRTEAVPPAPRAPSAPPPLPTLGAPQSPPRFAAPPLRTPEPAPQPPADRPAYPPRLPTPQPAPPGGMMEPPRPYEGGRYIPPPPIPPAGPSVTGRDWAPANTATVPAPQVVTRQSNPVTTGLLGIIAALLLALTIFQGINTFHPTAAPPTGVQQVQVQKQTLKPATAAEIKDTITKAQTALNQFNQQAQQAYAAATNDQQRAAVLLQLSLFLQQIIAQQNNDLLLIYQDLNT